MDTKQTFNLKDIEFFIYAGCSTELFFIENTFYSNEQ